MTLPGSNAASAWPTVLTSGAPNSAWLISNTIPRLGTYTVGERQGGGAEEVNVHIARREELAVFEVVIFKVFEAVAHIGLAAKKFVLPDHLAVTQDAAGTRQVLGQVADAQLPGP